MGTRGTLRVYVNDELKIRQYNQWDSYPTGQFGEICEYMCDKHLVVRFVQSLLNKKFAKAEDIHKIRNDCRHLSDDIWYNEAYITTLSNRDIGARIIPLMAGLPDLDGQQEVIPDWCDIFECNDESLMEEGNYVIRIECQVEHASKDYVIPDTVRFKLSGEFWGHKRDYDWNYIPTGEEIHAWETEANNDEGD